MACANQAWMFESGAAGERNISRAAQLVMRGVPRRAIQELLGHATIDMTTRLRTSPPT